MMKKLILLITLISLLSGCGFSSSSNETKDPNTVNQVAVSDSDTGKDKEESSISLISIKESSGKLLDKSGNALKSGGKYIADGSSKVAKSTGNFFLDCWNWTKDGCSYLWTGTKKLASSFGEWVGQSYDSVTNSDPMKTAMVKNSLANLKVEVDAYNKDVNSTKTSLDHLYETKNRTNITLKAVDRYTNALGTLPLGYDEKVVATKKDFGKYDQDLNTIQEELKKSEWDAGTDVNSIGNAAATTSGASEDAKNVDKAGDLMLKIASACGKDDASGMINTFKGATKVALSVGTLLSMTGADMGVTATLVVAGPIVMQMVDAASNALSERTKNKKMAAEADAKSIEVANARVKLEDFNTKVVTLDKQISEKEANVANLMSGLLGANVTTYANATEEQKKQINLLIDESTNLSKLLITTVQ